MKVRMIALAALVIDGETVAAGEEFRCDKGTARRLVRQLLAIQPSRYVAPEPEPEPEAEPTKPKRSRKSETKAEPEPVPARPRRSRKSEPAPEPEESTEVLLNKVAEGFRNLQVTDSPVTEEEPTDG